jgi:hypothetical protein
MGEVAASRSAIERETLADCEGVLHRLRAAEAAKLASLQGDADALAADVAAVDAFYAALQRHQPPPAGPSAVAAAAAGGGAGGEGGGYSAAGGYSGNGGYSAAVAVEFMRAYPQLCAEADRLQAKGIKAEVRAAGGGVGMGGGGAAVALFPSAVSAGGGAQRRPAPRDGDATGG